MNTKKILLALLFCFAVMAPSFASQLPASPAGQTTAVNNWGKSLQITAVAPGVTTLTITTRAGAVIFSGTPFPGLVIDTSGQSVVISTGFKSGFGSNMSAIRFKYI